MLLQINTVVGQRSMNMIFPPSYYIFKRIRYAEHNIIRKTTGDNVIPPVRPWVILLSPPGLFGLACSDRVRFSLMRFSNGSG